jgi:hypothetical protein
VDIIGGSAADTITAATGGGSITGGAGSDGITLVSAGTGSDTVILKSVVGTSGDSAYTAVSGNANDTGGDTITNFKTANDFIKVVATNVRDFDASTDVVIGGAAGSAGTGVANDFVATVGLYDLNGDGDFIDAGDLAVNFASATTISSATDLTSVSKFDLTGTVAADTIVGGTLADTIDGGAGNDVIDGGAGADVIDTGAGADVVIIKAVVGSSSNSARVDGANNADTGADVISNFAFGTDKIKVAFSGITAFNEIDGTEVINVDVGTATGSTYDGTVAGSFTTLTGLVSIDDADFNDTSDVAVTFVTPTYETGNFASNFASSVVFDLTGSAGSDVIMGTTTGDTISGGNGQDYLRGGYTSYTNDVDTIFGGAASTTLVNGVYLETADTISGNVNAAFISFMSIGDSTRYDIVFTGANILEGCQGNDVLVASTQKDVFLYQTNTGSGKNLGVDTIHSFRLGEDYIFAFETDGTGNSSPGDFTFTAGADGSSSTTTSGSLAGGQTTLNASTAGWAWAFDAGSTSAGTLSYTSENPTGGATSTNANFSIHLVGLLASGGADNTMNSDTSITANSFFL